MKNDDVAFVKEMKSETREIKKKTKAKVENEFGVF